ncbi:MAG: antibiotic biosynthesis monooxygenase [Polyangiaceae bacterium]|nr:antibiotic biosynthesis monooxygenase [Polyangiaceae bacterium]
MIVEYVRYRIPTDPAAFLAAYQAAASSLAASPDCLGWDLRRCSEDGACFILRIEWHSISAHLEGFRKSPAFGAFLAHVRPYIEQIEEMRHYEATDVSSRTVCEAMGGPEAFFRIAKEMHEAVRSDELLARRFESVLATHVPHLGMWLTEVFGGPRLYTTTLGDIGPMLARHAGLEITPEERERFVQLATAVAATIAPPGEHAALAAFGRYVAWGARIAEENARAGHVPQPDAGVPRWGWDTTG